MRKVAGDSFESSRCHNTLPSCFSKSKTLNSLRKIIPRNGITIKICENFFFSLFDGDPHPKNIPPYHQAAALVVSDKKGSKQSK